MRHDDDGPRSVTSGSVTQFSLNSGDSAKEYPSEVAGLEFRVLGPLEAWSGDERLDLGPRMQQTVFAALLVAAPETVAADTLIDRVWGARVPKSAGHALHVYVSNLRRLVDPGRPARSAGSVLVTRDPGYQLVVEPDQLDAARFEAGVEATRALAITDPSSAADELRQLLGLWRGSALSDFAELDWAAGEAARLDALRLTVTEEYFDAALRAGRHAAVVDELEAAARGNPLREGLWQHLMVALYRCGRQADSLRAYAAVRRHLVEELGIEPGAELRRLETAVLAHDPSLEPPTAHPVPAGSPPPHPEVEAGHSPPSTPRIAAGSARDRDSDEGSESEVADERRIVTVLFADLVGSTPLGEVLDDDEFKLVVDGAVERIVAACERYGGRIINVAGDGVAALFGAPVAHEDDAERAVLAGLEIVDGVDAYGQEVARSWGVDPVRARVGVNTGPVVTGLVGGGERVEFSAAGDTMNTAARLEAETEPGTVLVGAAVRAQLGDAFAFSAARVLDLKGKAEPVEAYVVTGGRPGGGRPRGLPGRKAPLVGRDAELDLLASLASEVNAGRGAAVFVSGEAGLGKSRMLDELRRLCIEGADPQRPVRWLDGTCISYGDSRPLWPVRRLVDQWIGVTPGLAPMRVRIALHRAVDDLFGDPETADRVYRALASLSGCDEDATTAQLGLSAESRQRELHDAFWLVLAALAADNPVVVAVDDLHWADDETIDVVDYLLPIIDSAPVLLAIGSRPEPGHPSWRIREHLLSEFAHRTRAIELEALRSVADADLLAELVGFGTIPDDVGQELLALAGGNPFYLEELIRSLIADGVVTEADGGFRFHGRPDQLRLPDTVQQVIVSRLDRLDAAHHRVLTTASVIGREFEGALLAALVDDVPLDSALVELQHLALVREVRRWPAPEYQFEHPLIQEAAHATLVGSDRLYLHSRVAAALVQHPDLDPSQARRARHLENAGEDAEAAQAYAVAAEDAERRGLMRAAYAHSLAGTLVVERLGDHADPGVAARLGYHRFFGAYFFEDRQFRADALLPVVELARRSEDPLLEARLLETAAMSQLFGGDEQRRRQLLVESLSAARRCDDLPTLVNSLARLAIDEANALELDVARARAVEAVELTEHAAAECRIPALDARKLVALYLGELDEMAAAIDELFGFEGHPDFDLIERYVVIEAALLQQARGRIDAALERADRAIALTEELGGPSERESFLAVRCRILRSAGEYSSALLAGREAFDAVSSVGHGFWLPWTAAEYGALLAELGAFDRAVDVLNLGCTSPESAMPSQELRCAAHLALAGVFAGDDDAEEAGFRVAEGLLSKLSIPDGHSFLYAADAILALAEAHLRRGRLEEAAGLAEPTSRAADAAGWHESAARAHYVSGLLAQARDDDAAARAEISAAIEEAEGLWPGVEWRGRVALAGVAGDQVSASSASDVVDRLCAGLTDDDGDALRGLLATLSA